MSPTTPAIPKVVFDCNVFLQAVVNPNGPSGRCKQLVDRGAIELYVSSEFQRRYPLLKIITPTDLLAEVETK